MPVTASAAHMATVPGSLPLASATTTVTTEEIAAETLTPPVLQVLLTNSEFPSVIALSF